MKPATFWATLLAVEAVSRRKRSAQRNGEEHGLLDFIRGESYQIGPTLGNHLFRYGRSGVGRSAAVNDRGYKNLTGRVVAVVADHGPY